jgi:hypothetical protein
VRDVLKKRSSSASGHHVVIYVTSNHELIDYGFKDPLRARTTPLWLRNILCWVSFSSEAQSQPTFNQDEFLPAAEPCSNDKGIALSGIQVSSGTHDANSSHEISDHREDTSPPPDLQVSRSGFGTRSSHQNDPCAARIIASQPLRAKEASPFISNKYPVVVCPPAPICLNFWTNSVLGP